MYTFLEFEKSIAELETKITELRHITQKDDFNIEDEVARLEAKVQKMLRQIYANLRPGQKVQIARHSARPHTSDYIKHCILDFIPLAGDRRFADDHALIGGLGRFGDYSVMVLGQEKGKDTDSRLYHNFGMMRPEGYRKAQRLMYLAERFGLPILTFIDTAGAYPGVGAEQRGQAEAIASCIDTCIRLKVPLICVIIGEGGSGGAIALAVADRVLMLEHAVYSVISPEGCASILWRDGHQAEEAAAALRLTAQDLKSLNIIDRIISEPLGGAHRHPQEMIETLRLAVKEEFNTLITQPFEILENQRQEKFLALGRLDPSSM